MKLQEYAIINAKKITQDVKLFRVKCNLNPLPGQFFEVSIPGIGECPLASCSYNKNYVDILLRNAGNLTSLLFNMKKGDKIFIRGPLGRGFPIKKLKNKNLIMVAGGTGLAPVTSLIDYIEKNKKDFKKITIYFGFRNENFILLKDRISSWKKIFNVNVCLDKKTSSSNECKQGYINEVISSIEKNSSAVLCGPEIMMKLVTEKLTKLGIPNKDIYWSMERRMECGFGSCGRCLIQDVYCCKDGPVFRYDFIKPKLENEQYSNMQK
ncbi:MAG: FAD/NAD(P)-binding protein [Candidatus Nanoarchaeia archaeon]